MSDWKEVEANQFRGILYIEEVNSNEGEGRRLNGIPTSTTVKSLKQSVATALNNPQGWSSLSVAFGDRELSDLNATLDSFGIQDGDTIFYTRRVTPHAVDAPPPYPVEKILDNVMFRDIDGKTLMLHFIPISWHVKQLRKKLGDEKALEVEYYRFIWAGKQLNDDKTLEDYGMGDNSTIHLVMRLKGGNHKAMGAALGVVARLRHGVPSATHTKYDTDCKL